VVALAPDAKRLRRAALPDVPLFLSLKRPVGK
jgi:hypothetical protein